MDVKHREAKLPILLLKTESRPNDAYRRLLEKTTIETKGDLLQLEPRFVPVLEHSFLDEGIRRLRSWILGRHVARTPGSQFGGFIFTSQRSVEAFSDILQTIDPEVLQPLRQVPFYSVGPATTRALRHIDASFDVRGDHTGNGARLSPFILEDYRQQYPDRETLPPLLFPVGVQRGDVIPTTLQDPSLPRDKRIALTQLEVYTTGPLPSLEDDFRQAILAIPRDQPLWIVVFSPTGGHTVVPVLRDMADDVTESSTTGSTSALPPRVRVATIGPTTFQYLQENFQLQPDVCCPMPSPEGLLHGLSHFYHPELPELPTELPTELNPYNE